MEQLKYKVVETDDDNNDNKGLPVQECGLVRSFSFSESEISSCSSLDSDSFEEVTSPVSVSSSSSSVDQLATEPLNDMSSLFQQLPIKRGLSKYYQGKAQSFTSLAKVRSLKDLVKPENPYNKKLKCCTSYGEVMGESNGAKCTPSVVISRQGSERGSENFMGRRPPIPPHRSTTTSSIPNQTALFV